MTPDEWAAAHNINPDKGLALGDWLNYVIDAVADLDERIKVLEGGES